MPEKLEYGSGWVLGNDKEDVSGDYEPKGNQGRRQACCDVSLPDIVLSRRVRSDGVYALLGKGIMHRLCKQTYAFSTFYYSVYSSAHELIASKIGKNVLPISVSEYSTRGGTTG